MDSLNELSGFQREASFVKVIEHHLVIAKMVGQSAGLLAIDIDNLQYFNAEYGHLAGNAAIGATATLIRAFFKEERISHFQSDDFYVLLLGTTLQEIVSVANEIKESAIVVEVGGIRAHGSRKCLSLSIGVSLFPDDTTDPDGLILVARSGVTRAKTLGRNCVVHAPSQRAE